RRRDGHGIGTRGGRPYSAQRHGLLQVTPREGELVGIELHAVHLPHAVPQRQPQAIVHHAPASHLIAELRGAVAPHDDVANLVFGLGLPFSFEAGARACAGMGRLVRSASYTSHTWTSLLPSWQSRRNWNVG